MYDIVLLDADMTIWDFEASEQLALQDVVERFEICQEDVAGDRPIP